MNILGKNLLAGAIVASLALTGAVIAEEELKHKVIEIKVVKDHDMSVWVDSDGETKTVIVDAGDLNNKVVLMDKLADLDEDSREIVLKALENVNMQDEDIEIKAEEVRVINLGDGESVNTFHADDLDIEVLSGKAKHTLRKKIFIDDDNEILKGHVPVITKLIERGEFTQDELDTIQAAIDAKR